MRITISVTEGPRMGEKFDFEGHDTFIVGRGDRAHFRPDKDDRFFSRFHFLVEVNPPQCRLMDMGSWAPIPISQRWALGFFWGQ